MGLNVYLAFLIGVVFGSIVTNILWSIQSARGTLKIDPSNPERDVYRIEIDDLDILPKRRKLVCKIEHNVDLSAQSQE